jgi:hypothetical protein
MRIKEIYERKAVKSIKVLGYIPIIEDTKNEISSIIAINANDENLQALSKISLFVFSKKEDAASFIELILNYYNNPDKSPRIGQKFWPTFREMIAKSMNYNLINNIAPSRRGIDNAIRDLKLKPQK